LWKKNQPKIIAHRGNCEGLPENSEAAFKQSVKYGIDGIETDVQLTKDNIPVIFHDRISFKLTKSRKWLSSYTLDELMEFNIRNEKILTLDKFLRSFSKETNLYIEIKSGRPEIVSGRSELLTRKVIKQVLTIDPKYQKNISILSFDPDVLKLAFSISNKFKYVLNLNDHNKKTEWFINSNELLNRSYNHNHLTGISIKENKLTRELIEFAHANKKTIFTYSCNTEQQLKRLLPLGLNAIMTGRVEWLTKLLK